MVLQVTTQSDGSLSELEGRLIDCCLHQTGGPDVVDRCLDSGMTLDTLTDPSNRELFARICALHREQRGPIGERLEVQLVHDGLQHLIRPAVLGTTLHAGALIEKLLERHVARVAKAVALKFMESLSLPGAVEETLAQVAEEVGQLRARLGSTAEFETLRFDPNRPPPPEDVRYYWRAVTGALRQC